MIDWPSMIMLVLLQRQQRLQGELKIILMYAVELSRCQIILRIFGQKSNFWRKNKFLLKNQFFWQKKYFFAENKIMVENYNFGRKLNYWQKIKLLAEN